MGEDRIGYEIKGRVPETKKKAINNAEADVPRTVDLMSLEDGRETTVDMSNYSFYRLA